MAGSVFMAVSVSASVSMSVSVSVSVSKSVLGLWLRLWPCQWLCLGLWLWLCLCPCPCLCLCPCLCRTVWVSVALAVAVGHARLGVLSALSGARKCTSGGSEIAATQATPMILPAIVGPLWDFKIQTELCNVGSWRPQVSLAIGDVSRQHAYRRTLGVTKPPGGLRFPHPPMGDVSGAGKTHHTVEHSVLRSLQAALGSPLTYGRCLRCRQNAPYRRTLAVTKP